MVGNPVGRGSNGTDAIELALRALDVARGDEVVTQATRASRPSPRHGARDSRAACGHRRRGLCCEAAPSLARSASLASEIVSLPMYPELTDEQVACVVAAAREAALSVTQG